MKALKWLAAVLAALLLVAAGILVAMASRPGAGTLSGSIEISASPQAIWPWLTEPDNLKRWVSWTIEAKRLDDRHLLIILEDPGSPGTRFQIHDELMTIDPPRSLTVRFWAADAFSGDSTYTLEPNGGVTRIRVVSHFRYDRWFARLIEPLVTPDAQKKENADLAVLKKLVEAAPH
ncbi:MAG: SRPBCC family protein [Bryobacteraceae bacterium]